MGVRFLFVVEDPGGVNAVLPAMAVLERSGHACVVYACGAAAAICERRGVAYEWVGAAGANALRDTAEQVLRFVRPGVVVTGTTLARPSLERAFWRATRAQGTPSLAVMDSWCDYRGRFVDRDGVSLVLPARVAAMDGLCRQGLMDAGVPGERIVLVGQPYLDDIDRASEGFGVAERRGLLARCGVDPGVRTVLFVCEPLGRPVTEAHSFHADAGADDRVEVALVHVLWALDGLAVESGRPLALLAKLHPRNTPQDAARLERLADGSRVTMAMVADEPPRALALAADAVVGLWSMLLVEAVLLGRPVVNVVLNPQEADNLVVDRLGLTCRAESPGALRRCLEGLLLPATHDIRRADGGAAARASLLVQGGAAADCLAEEILALGRPEDGADILSAPA